MELLLNGLRQVLNEVGAFQGNRELPKKKLTAAEVGENSPADTCVCLGAGLLWLLSAYDFFTVVLWACVLLSVKAIRNRAGTLLCLKIKMGKKSSGMRRRKVSIDKK